jgi:hypothetical protein
MAKRLLTDVGTVIAQDPKIADYDLLAGQSVTQIDGVRVFDIGQGDCSALLDGNGDPFLYVDYGGVIDHPDKPKYTNLHKRLPIDQDKTVVLTHWDWDHYNSGRHNPAAKTAQWLVPRQNIGPQALAFANKLTKAACWPESQGRTPVRFAVGAVFDIQVEKCAPRPTGANAVEDRNLTGLAVMVIRKDASGSDERFVLLPGDAPYDKIPSCSGGSPPGGDCVGMLAYHHGSHSHWTTATDQGMPGYGTYAVRLVYSFGASNSYHHPDRSNYQTSGWDGHGVETPSLRAGNFDYEDIPF